MELQEEARQRHATTVDSLTAELEEARDVARSTEQSASMVSATMGKAKLGLPGIVAHMGAGDRARRSASPKWQQSKRSTLHSKAVRG